MTEGFDLKGIFAVVGGLTGVYSFIRLLLGDFLNWRKKPHLTIEFDLEEDLRRWGDVAGGKRLHKAATVHIRNKGKMPASRCVAVLRPLSVPQGVRLGEKEYVLHWADTNYTTQSNVAEPVEIGLERRRLDVAFTVSVIGQDGPPIVGAWIAIPLALSHPAVASQAYLPPGDYGFRLTVGCQNGKSASTEFFVTSPETWTALSMRPAN